LKLNKKELTQYLLSGLEYLSSGLLSLDASRPWLCYWILHSLDLLNEVDNISYDLKIR
jgi:protein farnesyltransferase subunit beta